MTIQSNRLTIIVSDGAVYLDDLVYIDLDLSDCGIPNDVHALQWMIDLGEIEYTHSDDSIESKKPNDYIIELPDWALKCVDKWNEKYQSEKILMENL